jgi:hypothetical protein
MFQWRHVPVEDLLRRITPLETFSGEGPSIACVPFRVCMGQQHSRLETIECLWKPCSSFSRFFWHRPGDTCCTGDLARKCLLWKHVPMSMSPGETFLMSTHQGEVPPEEVEVVGFPNTRQTASPGI